jgi:outer membrane protein TolC
MTAPRFQHGGIFRAIAKASLVFVLVSGLGFLRAAPAEPPPLDLSTAISQALENNPATRSAWHRASAAQESVGVARAAYWPRIEATFRGGSDQWYTPAVSGIDHFRRVEATTVLGVEYLLLDFGGRAAQVDAAMSRFEAAGLGFVREVQSTVFRTQRAWFRWEAATSREIAAVAEWEAAKIALETTTLEHSHGLAAMPELLEARKRLLSAQYAREEAANAQRVARGEICTAMGQPANATLRLRPTTTHRPPSMAQRVDALVSQALAARPDLAARSAQMQAAEAEVRAARSEFWPKIRLEGNYGNTSFGYRAHTGDKGGEYATGLNGYGAALTVSWDLFDGFERTHRLARAKEDAATAQATWREEWLRVTSDVWQAYHDYLTAQSRLLFTEAWVASAREDWEAMRGEFDAGLQDRAALAEIRALQARADSEHATAAAEFSTAAANLAFSLGSVTRQEAAAAQKRAE